MSSDKIQEEKFKSQKIESRNDDSGYYSDSAYEELITLQLNNHT